MAIRTLRLAHRGDHRVPPENTIEAMRAALARPACDGLEFDVRTSADGISVVYHDATLDRLHGRPDLVADLTSADLEGLGIPTLSAVLAVADRDAFLDVELKTVPTPAFIEVLAAGRGPSLSRAVISSFDEVALERVGGLAPTWPTWLNIEKLTPAVLDAAAGLGCSGVSARWESIDAAVVTQARRRGLDVAAWTVLERATFDRLANLGLFAVCVEGEALDG